MSVQSGTGPEQRPPSALGQGEAAIPAGRNPFFSKLRVRLLTLVCLAILPALALVLLNSIVGNCFVSK